MGADLASRYRHYVERRTASAEAAREISHRLLERVVSGELGPSALEGGFNHFLHANGAEYANALVASIMRFLTGVVHAGTRDAYELVDDVLPGAVEPAPNRPPEPDPADWAASFQRLVVYAAEERAAQAAVLQDVVDRVAHGELDPG